MQFFSSFSSLGYSGIVLALSALFVAMMIFQTLKLHKRGPTPKILLFVVVTILFVFATNWLAEERRIMLDAIRDEGGLIRTQER